jgi:hypothetical protein
MLNRNLLKLIFIIFIAQSLSCVWYTFDKTNDEDFWGAYLPDTKYSLMRDVFIIKPSIQGMPSSNKILIPESNYKGRVLGRHFMAPNSIVDYLKNPKENSKHIINYGGKTHEHEIDVIGVVKAGTKLEVVKIEVEKGFNFMVGTFQNVTPFAKVLTGPYKGEIVDITDISVYYKNMDDIHVYRPERALIR